MTGQAVGYVRVSTEEQAAFGGSLAMQADRLALYCQLQDIELVDVIREKGVSGSVPLGERKGGRKLLELLAAGKVHHVVTLKLDRLFRDAADALTMTRQWDRSDIDMHLVDLGGMSLNTRSAGGRMMLTMLAGFAEWERNLIAERTRAVLWHKRAKRQAYSPTPLGFRREGKQLVSDDGEQATLTTIRALAAEGRSLNAIARELNARGIPTKTGKTWYASTVRYILGNVALFGKAA